MKILLTFRTHNGAVQHKLYKVKSGKIRVLTYCEQFGPRWLKQVNLDGSVREYDSVKEAVMAMRTISKNEGDSL